MAENKLKERWKAGKAAVNGWLAIPSGFSAEVMAQCGWDCVTVDMQHGVQDYQTMVQCFQAMDRLPVTKLVRVPWNEPGIIGKVLDGGAYGVICPMVNTKEEAEKLVAYSKYPPRGTRSNGPIRSGMYGSAGTYQATANDEIVLLPMMETRTAVENMESILDVDGINGVYIGPSDLGLSYGLVPKLDRDEPEILKIYEKIVKECGSRARACPPAWSWRTASPRWSGFRRATRLRSDRSRSANRSAATARSLALRPRRSHRASTSTPRIAAWAISPRTMPSVSM